MDSSTRRFDAQETEVARGQVAPFPPRATSPLPRHHPRAVLEPVIRRHSSLIGLGLIVLGALLFFGRGHAAAAFGAGIPLVIGLVFLYVYEDKNHHVGFLIPGAILTGLGLGGFVGMLIGLPGLFALGMGLGFAAIWYLHREYWWALIPGGILTLAGLSMTFSSYTLGWLLPFVLIGGGLWLLARQRNTVARR
jgi:hypothetical protein